MPSLSSSHRRERLLIVDLDDTLIRSRSNRASLLIETLLAYGVAVEGDKLETLWGRPFRELVVGLSPDVAARFDDFIDTYCDVLRESPPVLCPGVEASRELLNGWFRCALHTASHSRVAATDLASAALDTYFEHIVGSDRQTAPKPNSRSGVELIASLEGWSRRTANCCYIGDSITDMSIAEAAGLVMVGVDYGATSRDQWLEIGLSEDRIGSSFSEAVQIAQHLG